MVANHGTREAAAWDDRRHPAPGIGEHLVLTQVFGLEFTLTNRLLVGSHEVIGVGSARNPRVMLALERDGEGNVVSQVTLSALNAEWYIEERPHMKALDDLQPPSVAPLPPAGSSDLGSRDIVRWLTEEPPDCSLAIFAVGYEYPMAWRRCGNYWYGGQSPESMPTPRTWRSLLKMAPLLEVVRPSLTLSTHAEYIAQRAVVLHQPPPVRG